MFDVWNEMLNLYFVKKELNKWRNDWKKNENYKMSYEVASKNLLKLNNILIIIIITLFLLCYAMFVSYS